MKVTNDGMLVATGCEPWLAGWRMGRAGMLPIGVRAIGGCVLSGYVAAQIARSQGLSLSDEAALATWTQGTLIAGGQVARIR